MYHSDLIFTIAFTNTNGSYLFNKFMHHALYFAYIVLFNFFSNNLQVRWID